MAVSGDPDDVSKNASVIVIAGPTASGKSSLAIELAREFGAEIISADSRQIYRDLKIGTDRLDPEEQQGVPHHLMGIIGLDERFTAFDFAEQAGKLIEEINSRGKDVIICGGTGLYLRALIEGIVEIPDDDFEYRNRLLDLASTRGPGYIYEKLKKIDPAEAEKIHPHNMIRVIRALEIYHITGRTKTELMTFTRPYKEKIAYTKIVLVPARELLYKRIENRVDEMVAGGLFEEVKALLEAGRGRELAAAKVVGYGEVINYFENRIGRAEAINLIKQNTRRYAKRQFTWFKRAENAVFITKFGDEARDECRQIIKKAWPARKI